jgi:ankyrin repeat protein
MIDSSSILDCARVPGTGVFFLGCFESRVTVLSQQRRALNLVDAILTEQIVRPHGRVAIVGAGAAGLTAAAAFAVTSPELRIDLFERQSDLMHLQRSSDRDLHPHIYDWPNPGSTEQNAGLPLLNWRAGPAKSVAAQITDSFGQIRRQFGDRLTVYPERFVSSVSPVGKTTGCTLKIENSPTDGGAYDAVILAIGFGYERPGLDRQHLSYWMPAQLIGPFSPGAIVLVSGNGDGGLVDFALAALKHLDHSAMIDLMVNQPRMDEVASDLIKIEEQAWKEGANGSFDIVQHYLGIDLPDQLLLDVIDNLKSGTEVWFHTKEQHLFRCNTAILNRFTAFVVMQADAKYGSKKINSRNGIACVWEPSDGTAQIGLEKLAPTVRAFRFGPAKDANLLPFQNLAQQFKNSRPPASSHYRPATPELSAGARARFRAAADRAVPSAHTTTAPVAAPPPPCADPIARARQWLAERNVPLSPESLDLYIRSGVAEPVVNLLQAGLSPNTLLQGVSPLEIALKQLDTKPRVGGERTTHTVEPYVAPSAELDSARVEIVRAIVAARPRGIAQAAHDALDKLAVERLVALARAGIRLDIRDAEGQSLAARAMRHDDDAPRNAISGWTDLLVREGALLPQALAPWIILWAASTNRDPLLARLLDDRVPVDSSTHETIPTEPIRESELGFWWPGGTALHRLLARAERPYATLYSETETDLYSEDLLRLLLRHGASPGAIDATGRTPLHIAAREGLEYAATQLMKAPGADLTRADDQGATALDNALERPRSSRIAQMLVARGLPSDPVSRARALHQAAHNCDFDVLRVLLDAGCDPNATFRDVPSALMNLAQNRDYVGPHAVSCLGLLLERGANPSLRDTRGRTALHWLAQGKELEAVERLLEVGVDPDMADGTGRTPLMITTSAVIAQRLLAAGAQPTRQDGYGYDALDHAAMYNRTDIIPLLETADRRPRAEAEIIRAILDRNASRVAELLTSGVPANTLTPTLGTPLLNLAAHFMSSEIVELLLDRGAAIDGRDADGRTALYQCLNSFNSGDRERCLTLLLDRGASVESIDVSGGNGEAAIFKGFAWWHIPSVATRLLEACLNERSRKGATALMVAAERGSADQVAALLGKGLDPCAVDLDGRTALHYAAVDGITDDRGVQKATDLLRAGANLELADNAGETPLMVAVARRNYRIVDLLIEKGADQTRRNAAGETLQRIALRSRDASLINRLCSSLEGGDQDLSRRL